MVTEKIEDIQANIHTYTYITTKNRSRDKQGCDPKRIIDQEEEGVDPLFNLLTEASFL